MLYARLKPFNFKQGFILNRYHFQGNLFVGGERPTWYRVDEALGRLLKADEQETGRASFDVVTPEEKVVIDKIEEERRMVQMGMMAATLPVTARANPVDLTPARASARESAIPESRKTSESGDLSTVDLKNPLVLE